MMIHEHDSIDEREDAREWARRPIPSRDHIYTVTDKQLAVQYAANLRSTMRPGVGVLAVRARRAAGIDVTFAWLKEQGYAI